MSVIIIRQRPLDEVKVELKARIDAEAEAQRLQHITGGAGQVMEYQQSAAEATRLLAAVATDPAHEPAAADYPMLAASLGINGETLAEVANVVAAMHMQWQTIGAAIREVRLGAKAAIDAATTIEEAVAATDAVDWP